MIQLESKYLELRSSPNKFHFIEKNAINTITIKLINPIIKAPLSPNAIIEMNQRIPQKNLKSGARLNTSLET